MIKLEYFFFIRETKKIYKSIKEFLNKKIRDNNNMINISPKNGSNTFLVKSKNFNEEKKDVDIFSELANPCLKNRSIKSIIYLNEQIKFFANLAMSRNSLWKKYLENEFPIKMIFNQINNKKLLKG